MTLEEYFNLITVEHSDKPLFMAGLGATLEEVKLVSDSLEKIGLSFDIDTAIGVQLDILGIWIGRSRYVATPIVGAYFSWGDTTLTGWQSGSWKGAFDPASGLTSLPDDAYRILLKAKIAANNWDGSVEGAYEVWAGAFGSTNYLLIQDNQNMSMIVGIVGPPMSAITKALLSGGYIPLKPEGVRVSYVVSPDTGPLFAWGVTNGITLDGWGAGRWGIKL